MKQIQSSAVYTNPEYQFDIHIHKVRWLPLFIEQWLVPRFVLTITNKGKDIDKGEINCELVEHDEVSSFPSIKKGFNDFQHLMLDDFKNGDRRKFNLKIESRFIRPSRYMIRILIHRWEPQYPRDMILQLSEIEKLLRGQALDPKIIQKMSIVVNKKQLRTFEEKIKHLEESINDLHRRINYYKTLDQSVPCQYTGENLIDWRWLEVIKIHPISTLLSIIATIGAIVGMISAILSIIR